MTIGPITISAADWLSTRLEERMALASAAPAPPASVTDTKTIGPLPAADQTETGTEDRHQRERALLAAQDSYRRVAQRIKARLANPVAELPPRGKPEPQANHITEARTVNEAADNGQRATAIITEQVDPRDRTKAGSATSAEPMDHDDPKGIWDDLFVDRHGSDSGSRRADPA